MNKINVNNILPVDSEKLFFIQFQLNIAKIFISYIFLAHAINNIDRPLLRMKKNYIINWQRNILFPFFNNHPMLCMLTCIILSIVYGLTIMKIIVQHPEFC